jgi:hypothetical protein
MTKRQYAFMWYQKVILRGIEGILNDQFLLQIMSSYGAEADEAMRNTFEAKQMAEQLYADANRWTV